MQVATTFERSWHKVAYSQGTILSKPEHHMIGLSSGHSRWNDSVALKCSLAITNACMTNINQESGHREQPREIMPSDFVERILCPHCVIMKWKQAASLAFGFMQAQDFASI